MLSEHIVANPIQKKISSTFCHEEFDAQVYHLRNKFKLINYNPQLTINHSLKAVASYGGELVDGEPYVVLALKDINARVGSTQHFQYEEYPFLKKKPGIGDGEANWKLWCAWLIAHELAHTLVEVPRFREAIKPFFPHSVTRDIRAHGLYWQELYRYLRCGLCKERDAQGAYAVKFIDFSDHVFHTVSRKGQTQHLTFFRGEEAVAHYVREGGILYRTGENFRGKRKTRLKTVRDVKRTLVTA